MELAVYNIKGEDTGKKVTLNDEVFALAEPNEHAVYLDVKHDRGWRFGAIPQESHLIVYA